MVTLRTEFWYTALRRSWLCSVCVGLQTEHLEKTSIPVNTASLEQRDLHKHRIYFANHQQKYLLPICHWMLSCDLSKYLVPIDHGTAFQELLIYSIFWAHNCELCIYIVMHWYLNLWKLLWQSDNPMNYINISGIDHSTGGQKRANQKLFHLSFFLQACV